MVRLPPDRTLARRVAIEGGFLYVDLQDGRLLGVPLHAFPRLQQATPEQRARFILLGDGEIISWPDLDEDIEVVHLLLP